MAPRIADALQQFETSLAAARADALALGMVLVRAPQDARVSPTTGHQIHAALTRSISGIDQALTGADTVHRLTEALAKRFGVDPTAYGEQKDPPSFFVDASDRSDQRA